MRSKPNIISNIRQIVDQYDGFILDQYGVLHNGSTTCPGAVECLEKLFKRGKKLMLLSNSSKRSNLTLERLSTHYGMSREWFLGAVTSGEEVCQSLLTSPIGKSCIWLTWTGADLSYLNECQVRAASSIEQADFILAHGSQDIVFESRRISTQFHSTSDLSMHEPILRQASAAGLPMVCANPDLISVQADGSIAHMPGKIAQRYTELGGRVIYYGKPHATHFQTCINQMDIDPSRIVHVGDSLHHDIQGANNARVDSILVANGIHAQELGLNPVDGRRHTLQPDRLDALLESVSCTPTHAITSFSW